jgi:hypothetical protein
MKLICTILAALGLGVLAAPAGAAPPDKETLVFVADFVDTGECGFPIAVHAEFRNMIIDGTQLQLHQSDVETWTANGVTLTVNSHYTIFVTFVDDIPVASKHVGVLDSIAGPNGEHLFFRTGQADYEVVFDPTLGFYVDGPLLARHGVRDNFDAAKVCGAFN